MKDAAIEAYTGALKGGSTYIPADEVRDRLKVLVNGPWFKRPPVIAGILGAALITFLAIRFRPQPGEDSAS